MHNKCLFWLSHLLRKANEDETHLITCCSKWIRVSQFNSFYIKVNQMCYLQTKCIDNIWGSKMMINLNHNFSQKTTSFSSTSPGFHMGLREPVWVRHCRNQSTSDQVCHMSRECISVNLANLCQACQDTDHLVFKFFLKMLARQGEKRKSAF